MARQCRRQVEKGSAPTFYRVFYNLSGERFGGHSLRAGWSVKSLFHIARAKVQTRPHRDLPARFLSEMAGPCSKSMASGRCHFVNSNLSFAARPDGKKKAA